MTASGDDQPQQFAKNDTAFAEGYFELQGSVVMVTGASSGLGRHFARVLARAGCKVGLMARREDRLQAVASEMADDSLARHAGGCAIALPCDVTDVEAVQRAFDILAEKAGPVSVLVNNAGVGKPSNFISASSEDTESVFDINQYAVWKVGQIAARQMIDAGIRGSIINIASILGLRVMPGAASYAVSKAAVVQMTRVMALELARYNIRANAIAPGYFATEMNSDFLDSEEGRKVLHRSPMRRAGRYEELDGLLLLLSSQRSTFMTGAIIPVDGGHLNSSL